MANVITLLGCLSLHGDPNQNQPVRVCRMSHKIGDEEAQLDISDCKLALSGLDTTDFKMCPFCISSFWKSPLSENVGEAKTYATRIGSGELISVAYMPTKVNDTKAKWLVGLVLSSSDLSKKDYDMISPTAIQPQRQQIIEALKTLKAYDESSFGLYILTAL